MPELRKDPIIERWVIVASDRAARPHDYRDNYVRAADATCPFCAGHEHETPSELYSLRSAGSPAWRVRVVPNRYPALESPSEPPGPPAETEEDLFLARAGYGAHEVIVESARHVWRTVDVSVAELGEVLLVWRERLNVHRREGRLAHGSLFKNVGAAGGASIEHAHSQLIVTPMVPTLVAEELAGSASFFHAHGRCVYCELVERERALGSRLIAEHPGFVVLAPYASRLPLETWIVPRRHASHFEQTGNDELNELAVTLHATLVMLEEALEPVAYNLVLHTAPFDTSALGHYHWHIEIIPRVTKTAGFEWGSGFYVNPLPPEEAAKRLREVAAGLQAR